MKEAPSMSLGAWERRGLLGGILFVVLFLAGVGAAGETVGDDPAATAAYFASHRTQIMIGNHVAGLGLVVFLAWCWAVMTLVDRAGGREARLGAAIFVTGALTTAVEYPLIAINIGLAYVSTSAIDAGVAHTLANLAQVFSYVDYFPTAAFFAAIGVAILRTSVISRWFGWSAIVFAIVCLIVAAPSLKLDVPSAILTMLWIAAASIAFFRAAARYA